MEKKLFDAFPPVSAKAWKQRIRHDIAKRGKDQNLVWQSPEGIAVRPFYYFDDLKKSGHVATGGPHSWSIAQRIEVSEPALANSKALDALRRGAESIIFTVPSKNIDILRLLEGIDSTSIPIHYDFGSLSTEHPKKLLDFIDGPKGNIHLDLDILGNLAKTGNWCYDWKRDFEIVDEIISPRRSVKNHHSLAVDMALYQNAGANIVQQLAYALAHANEYLNYFEADAMGVMDFNIAVGGNYFFEIAKIRALRILWKALAAEYDICGDCHITAVPSRRNKTVYAYNSNLLRTTTECMSAIIGGANTVCNLPYDAIYHEDNEFAERIARNQLLILKEESHFEALKDPASGSYYIESLTHELAEKALILFKEIEADGGFLEQLKNNTIQRDINESAAREQHLFDTGEEILVGANAFQNANDFMVDDLERNPFRDYNPSLIEDSSTAIEPIPERRLAEETEKRRLEEEGYPNKSG